MARLRSPDAPDDKSMTAIATTAGTNSGNNRLQVLNRRATPLRSATSARSARAASLTHTLRLHLVRAPTVNRAATPDHRIFLDRNRFAVTMDSSIALDLFEYHAIYRHFSPGRTRSRSPTRTSSNGTSCSCPSAPMQRAFRGQTKQRSNRIPQLSTCAQFQQLPNNTSV